MFSGISGLGSKAGSGWWCPFTGPAWRLWLCVLGVVLVFQL